MPKPSPASALARTGNTRPTPGVLLPSHVPAQVRQNRIVEIVHDRGFISVPLVAGEFQVSEMTIRRDLAKLERSGLVLRTHGGAIVRAVSAGPALDREEPAFELRLQQNRAVKERIAAAAADLLVGSRTVALDVGTTTYFLAKRLIAQPNLMFFTNSLRIAALLDTGGNEVHVPGGQVRKGEMSVFGASAVAHFDRLWFDIAFIGVSGLTAEGLYDYSAEDSEMKRAYLRRSGRKVVLCDSLKFRRMSLVQVAALAQVDLIVTDRAPPPELQEALDLAGVEVRIAPELPPGAA